MAHVTIERTLDYAADPRRIWPAIADTNLIGEIYGAGRYDTEDVLQPDGSVLRHAHGDKLAPLASEWTEDLGEWVYARYCAQRRWFGPDGRNFVQYRVRLEPGNGTTHVAIRIEMQSSNPLIWIGA